MFTEFVQFTAEDGAVLHGLLFLPQSQSSNAVIHVHGLAGNFYENEFVGIMAQRYTDAGMVFLSFNNRGHDYISDIAVDRDGVKTDFKGGAAYERFEDCVFDISAAIRFLRNRGISRVCLQGHSTGCNKLVYALSRDVDIVVRGVALLSPCDDIAVMDTYLGDKFTEGLEQARQLVNEGKGDRFVDDDKSFYPMTANTYLAFYESGSAHDVFPYRTPDNGFTQFSQLEVPILVTFGTDGEYLNDSFETTVDILRTKLEDKDLLAAQCVQGAPHNYSGKSDELVAVILDWLSSIHF